MRNYFCRERHRVGPGVHALAAATVQVCTKAPTDGPACQEQPPTC